SSWRSSARSLDIWWQPGSPDRVREATSVAQAAGAAVTWIIHEHVVRLAAFASKTELRKPEKRGSGLSSAERGAQPFRTARPVAGLRRIFRAITTACSDGFRRERAESLKKFVVE